MIDLANIKFVYSKEEVENYIQLNNKSVEELLKTLAEEIKIKARVPISKFRVGAAAYTSSGRIFMGTNMEFLHLSINHTVHAEQCTLSNVYMNSLNDVNERILILVVSEVPCGHCRQILQELPDAPSIRIIIPKHNIDQPLSSLLPYTFELPIDGVVHHLFEKDSVVPFEAVESQLTMHLESLRSMLKERNIEIADSLWEGVDKHCADLFKHSYTWYSGHPSIALFISPSAIAFGGCIESSAYNPTVNPLQMALIDCELNDIQYEDLVALVLIEMDDATTSYEGYLCDLSSVLTSHPIEVFYKLLHASPLC